MQRQLGDEAEVPEEFAKRLDGPQGSISICSPPGARLLQQTSKVICLRGLAGFSHPLEDFRLAVYTDLRVPLFEALFVLEVLALMFPVLSVAGIKIDFILCER